MWPFKEKISIWKVGILVGLAESAYCGLVALLLWGGNSFLNAKMNGISGVIFGLMLLVFSVAVSGILVFGYPMYLAIEKKYKEAFQTAGITLLTIFVMLALVFAIVSIVSLR